MRVLTPVVVNLGIWELRAAVGIEVKRFYVGVNYFQNCVNDRDLKLGLSVGYKFTLF